MSNILPKQPNSFQKGKIKFEEKVAEHQSKRRKRKTFRTWLTIIAILVVITPALGLTEGFDNTGPYPAELYAQCWDGIDNDGDGRTDLEDPDCPKCFDNVDNEPDGSIDAEDSDCPSFVRSDDGTGSNGRPRGSINTGNGTGGGNIKSGGTIPSGDSIPSGNRVPSGGGFGGGQINDGETSGGNINSGGSIPSGGSIN